jgi:predicted transposase YdaD
MQTDQLFQEYFQVAPGALFELLQIQPPCAYQFTSPVFKTSERRMDGFLAPAQSGNPYYFVEFQGYRDKHIYWRALYPVVRHHEMAADLKQQMWKVVVLFLDKAHDPGVATLGPLAHDAKRWLISGVIPDLLAHVPNASPLLNVLRPLLVATVEEVEREGPLWVQSIQQMPQLNPGQHSVLVDLLVKFIMQRFVQLPYKELERMLNLTPLEQTRAGRELIELGETKGREEGREEGRVEGRVEGLHDAIRIVLLTRFPHTLQELMTRLMALLSYIHDIETVEMLLQLATQTDSFAIFEQKVLETVAKSALQKNVEDDAPAREETQ